MKQSLVLTVGIAMLSVALLYGAAAPKGPTATSCPSIDTGRGSIQILPPEVTRDLDLALRPGQDPKAVQIGTYWNCLTDRDTGLEHCDIELVFCTREGHCVQVP